MKKLMRTGISVAAAIQMLSSAAHAEDPGNIFIRRDTVIPATFNDDLSISRNREGDYFSVVASRDSRDLRPGARLEGHVVRIHRRDDRRPASMDLQFDDVILPDGSRAAIHAVPIPLSSRAVSRDRDGRFRADQRKVHTENIALGGLAGGLLVGALIHKPFEGAFIGGLLGILGAEATRNDPANNDLVARRGSKIGVLFQDDVQIDTRSPQYRSDNGYVGWRVDVHSRNPDPYREDGTRSHNLGDEVTFEGRTLRFGADDQPFREGNILMVPVMATADFLHIPVDQMDNSPALFLNGSVGRMRLEQGSASFRLNGKRGDLPAPVEIRRGVLFAPIEAFAAVSRGYVYVNGVKVEYNT